MFKNYRTAIAASFTFVLSVHWHSEKKVKPAHKDLKKKKKQQQKNQPIHVRVNIKSEI